MFYCVKYKFYRTTINGQVVVIGPKRRAPFKQWMSSAFCAALIGCLSLAHAVVMTDGFYKTCEQYKRGLIQLLGSRGREAHVGFISNFSCILISTVYYI